MKPGQSIWAKNPSAGMEQSQWLIPRIVDGLRSSDYLPGFTARAGMVQRQGAWGASGSGELLLSPHGGDDCAMIAYDGA